MESQPYEVASQEPEIDLDRVEEHDQNPAEPGSGFQFINETGFSRPRGVALHLIRSQAKRRGSTRDVTKQKTRQRRQLLPSSKTEGRREPSNQAASTVSSYIGPRNATTSLGRHAASNRIDPFGILQLNERKEYQSWISQYYNVFEKGTKNRLSTIRPAWQMRDTLEFTLSDSALSHLALAFAAQEIYALAKLERCPEHIYHVNQAIAIINKRIANSSHEPITNGTILTVASLTLLELYQGSISSVKLHLNGLEALVNSRGGIKVLLHDPFILRQICWADIFIAVVLELKPRFVIATSAQYPGPKDLAVSARYESKLSNMTGMKELSQETVEKEKVAAMQGLKITNAEYQALELYSHYLMHRLLTLAQYEHATSSKPSQNALIYKLFANAGFAHILLFTIKSAAMVGIPILLSTRIRTILEEINIRSFQIAYPEMMLWIIMVGGLASIGTVYQGWFTNVLADSCSAAGIVGTGELAHFLTDFLWSDFYVGEVFEKLWDDVRVTQSFAVGELDENG